MAAIVFLGPTLSREIAREHLDAVFAGPVMRGDVLRALHDAPDAIGIVDGYFELVPSVWHKEILVALSRGVPVYGAASMGALRAAELRRYGMIGVGEIYEGFASGALEDDDEVAIAHGPAEDGYREISDAMVNIRDVVRAGAAEGIVSQHDSERMEKIAKGLFYPERSFRRVFDLARADGIDPRGVDALAELARRRVPLKRRDAIAMLDRMAKAEEAPRPAVDVERTVFLDRLRSEVEASLAAGSPQAPDLEGRRALEQSALLRKLATREVSRLGMRVSDERLREAISEFRSAHDLDEAALGAFLAEAGVSQAAFTELMRETAAVRLVERHLEADVQRALPDSIRLSRAAAARARSPGA